VHFRRTAFHCQSTQKITDAQLNDDQKPECACAQDGGSIGQRCFNLPSAQSPHFKIIEERCGMDNLSPCMHGHRIILFCCADALRRDEPAAPALPAILQGRAAANTSAPMTMSCADGPTYQCSGSSIIRIGNSHCRPQPG
jgi:hypothetical protein